MEPQNPIADIAHVIQLSVAPVFLLTAVGTLLSVMSARLGRIVDRARSLHDRGRSDDVTIAEELALLTQRRRLINIAITGLVCSAVCVAAVISSAFIGFLASADVSNIVAVLFLGSMCFFIGGLLLFLREVLLASRTVDIELRRASSKRAD